MAKSDQPTTPNLEASPPAKRKNALIAATVILAIWILTLASLAVYSVWG